MAAERYFSEALVAELAAREKQMQQHYRPVIGVHKWFARRPGCLFRALALAELDDRPVRASYLDGHELTGVCLDPFMGGGTPLAEASRLGLSVIGYDTNPMSRWVVERELEAVDPDALAAAGERVAVAAARRVDDLYTTTCPDCEQTAQARYFFWVRHHRCSCGREHPLLADTKLVSTGLRRHLWEVHLCAGCMHISEHPDGCRPYACPHCDEPFAAHLVPPDTVHACACGQPYRIPPQGSIETPCQRLAAVDFRCDSCHEPAQRAYKTADAADHDRVDRAARRARRRNAAWPEELIPSGDETQRLLRWGYQQWQDLFGPRQLYGLGVLADTIAQERDPGLRTALQTVFSDMLRYHNALVRYDRQALKPTDVFAVHGFPVPRVSCEVALLGEPPRGSGGFRHILAKYVRAKRWCAEPYETMPGPHQGSRSRHVYTEPERVAAMMVDRPEDLGDQGRALLRRASLSTGDLPAESVDMVLTDPPYFANVQYAELMDFFYAWLRRIAPETSFFDVAHTKTTEDAVGAPGSVGLADFAHRLSGVYVAAAHALKRGGLFAFTYHHNDLDAYAPLIVACLDAGLTPTGLFACPSEMRASTHIHGRNAATTDAVFMLRKAPAPIGATDFAGIDPRRIAENRARVLRNAGLTVTAADRRCLRYAAASARAMAVLADGWSADRPVAERVADAVMALAPQAPAVV